MTGLKVEANSTSWGKGWAWEGTSWGHLGHLLPAPAQEGNLQQYTQDNNIHKIIENPKLKGTYKNHQVQLGIQIISQHTPAKTFLCST